MTDAVLMAIITAAPPTISIVGVYLLGLRDAKKQERIAHATAEEISRRMADTAAAVAKANRGLEAVHTIVNSQNTELLKQVYNGLERIAQFTGKKADIDAAREAEAAMQGKQARDRDSLKIVREEGRES